MEIEESEKREGVGVYPFKVSGEAPSLKEKLIVRVRGRFLAFHDGKSFSREMPIYLAKCRFHGYFLDYPHGYKDRLDCPECSRRFHEQSPKQRILREQLVT